MAHIKELIDEQLYSELIRDMIAAILITERDNQKALALADDKDVSLWDFDVVKEQSMPVLMSVMTEESESQEPPRTSVVNVWLESLNENGDTTDNTWQYGYDLSINVDILSSKRSKRTSTGYEHGDTLTAYELQRTIKLVHKILLAGSYRFLNMQRVVLNRKLVSITTFQPDINDRPLERILGARLKFIIQTHEYTPQILPADPPSGISAPSYNDETLDESVVTIADDAGNTLVICNYDQTL